MIALLTASLLSLPPLENSLTSTAIVICEKRLRSDSGQSRYKISNNKCNPLKNALLKRLYFLPSEHYATVALNFKDMAAQTELQLECKGVPVSNEDSTRQCWKKQYFEEIRTLLQQAKDNME